MKRFVQSLWIILVFLLSGTSAVAQNLDQYGGYTNLPVPGGATGYFRVGKLGSRWVFVTPKGNAFWMLGVFNVTPAMSYTVKYPNTSVWGDQTSKRLQAWGFNFLAIYPSTHVLPKAVGGDASVSLPYTFNLWPSHYGLTNNGNYAPGPFKDLVDCLDATYTGYRGGSTPDVFDPNFDAYVNGRLNASLADSFWGPTLSSPWSLGITTDDADQLYGFGPGPEIPGTDGAIVPHIGWFAISVSPQKLSSTKWGVTYSDTKVYTKFALRNFLSTRYGGSIAVLNAAWGSNYTTFDSNGGWGTGTGLLDEDGRHAWLGKTNGTLTGATPAVAADLDAFLYKYAKQYFSILRTRIKQHFPKQLVLGPATLNSHGGLTRKQILHAAGEYLDVLNVGITSRLLDKTAEYAGDIPIITWEGYVANPDSGLYRYPNPPWAFSTQQERARAYSEKLNFLFDATTTAGINPVVGIQLWEWSDNWSEKLNWGLVSFRENAYDGKEAVTSACKDVSGYPTGGEEKDYGDFISTVRKTNKDVMERLIKAVMLPDTNAANEVGRR